MHGVIVNLEGIDAVLESERGLTLRIWIAYDPKFEVVAQVQGVQGRGAYIEEALQTLNDALVKRGS